MDICPDCGKKFRKHHILVVRCKECQRKNKREINRRSRNERRASRILDPHGRGVEVIYCDGGVDRYGKRTFLAWLQEGAFRPGDMYIMDGERHVVCEVQQSGV